MGNIAEAGGDNKTPKWLIFIIGIVVYIILYKIVEMIVF